MNTFLYHVIFEEGHPFYISPDEVLKKGVLPETKSNYFYTNGGEGNLELIEKFRPLSTPVWVDFPKAIGAHLVPHFPKQFAFPVFTEKILVFDGQISSMIYDQDNFEQYKQAGMLHKAKEEGVFDTGISLDRLVQKYWASMMALDEYLDNEKYEYLEILIFEPVPKEIIRMVKK
jgi:hypothetical protein